MISTVIMAHVARTPHANKLAHDLNATISLDDGALGENTNGDRAWSMVDKRAEWGLVVQDDALPVDGLTEKLEVALKSAPETLVSLYVGTIRPRWQAVNEATQEADANGYAWLRANALLWGVAVAMPTSLIDETLEQCRGIKNVAYDQRLGLPFRWRQKQIYYLWPSLVDHADGKSLVGHRCEGRRARRLGTASDYGTPAAQIADRDTGHVQKVRRR